LPAAAVARQTGEIFVTYLGLVAPAQPRVFVTRSADQGATWSAPVQASDQPAGVSVTNPAIAARPDGRSVSVVFMDKRNAPDGANFVDHYAALSFDGGATWQPNIRLSEISSDIRYAVQTPTGAMLGDYLGLVAPTTSEKPCVAIWCDTRTGDSDPIAVRFAASSAPSFESWRIARFPAAQLSSGVGVGAQDDPDQDFVENEFEYRFGTNPLMPEAGEFVAIFDRGAARTISYQQRVDEPDLTGMGASYYAGAESSVFGLFLGLDGAPPVTPRSGMRWVNFELNPRGGPGRINFNQFSDAAIATNSRLINLSTRGRSDTAAAPLIVGFVIDGGSKSVLLRAIGPTLAQFGTSGALADPQLELIFGSLGQLTVFSVTNDNWATSPGVDAGLFTRIGAFALSAASADSAILQALPSRAYTAIVSGANNASGLALVEAYDADPMAGAANGSRFLNLSTRGEVSSGDNVLVAGFVISGAQPRRVLVRAVGPTLAQLGVANALADPTLTLFRGSTRLATNDDWEISRSGAAIAVTAQRLGAFHLNAASLDAALLITLVPGSYTVVVDSADGGTGIALVEIYDAD
jgi:hypothetical protein